MTKSSAALRDCQTETANSALIDDGERGDRDRDQDPDQDPCATRLLKAATEYRLQTTDSIVLVDAARPVLAPWPLPTRLVTGDWWLLVSRLVGSDCFEARLTLHHPTNLPKKAWFGDSVPHSATAVRGNVATVEERTVQYSYIITAVSSTPAVQYTSLLMSGPTV